MPEIENITWFSDTSFPLTLNLSHRERGHSSPQRKKSESREIVGEGRTVRPITTRKSVFSVTQASPPASSGTVPVRGANLSQSAELLAARRCQNSQPGRPRYDALDSNKGDGREGKGTGVGSTVAFVSPCPTNHS